jgi:hypothetical protein
MKDAIAFWGKATAIWLGVTAVYAALVLGLIALLAYLADVDLTHIKWRSIAIMYAIIAVVVGVLKGLKYMENLLALRARMIEEARASTSH